MQRAHKQARPAPATPAGAKTPPPSQLARRPPAPPARPPARAVRPHAARAAHLAAQHEGLQDLVQAVDHDHPLLHLQPVPALAAAALRARDRLAKPLGKHPGAGCGQRGAQAGAVVSARRWPAPAAAAGAGGGALGVPTASSRQVSTQARGPIHGPQQRLPRGNQLTPARQTPRAAAGSAAQPAHTSSTQPQRWQQPRLGLTSCRRTPRAAAG